MCMRLDTGCTCFFSGRVKRLKLPTGTKYVSDLKAVVAKSATDIQQVRDAKLKRSELSTRIPPPPPNRSIAVRGSNTIWDRYLP